LSTGVAMDLATLKLAGLNMLLPGLVRCKPVL